MDPQARPLDAHLDAWLAVDQASSQRAAAMQLTGLLSLPLGVLATWPEWFSAVGARTVLTLWGFSVLGTAWSGFVEWRTLRAARGARS
jgi:hypothetical protein